MLGREDGCRPSAHKDSALPFVVGILVSERGGPLKLRVAVVAKSPWVHGSALLVGSADNNVPALPMCGRNGRETNFEVVQACDDPASMAGARYRLCIQLPKPTACRTSIPNVLGIPPPPITTRVPMMCEDKCCNCFQGALHHPTPLNESTVVCGVEFQGPHVKSQWDPSL